MIKIPKDLKPNLKIDLQCSACLYINKRPYKYIKSVYKDGSFPGFKYLKCKNCDHECHCKKDEHYSPLMELCGCEKCEHEILNDEGDCLSCQ